MWAFPGGEWEHGVVEGATLRRPWRGWMSTVASGSALTVALTLMSFADTGRPSDRPERVLNIAGGPRGRHGGAGNALSPFTELTPSATPDAPIPPPAVDGTAPSAGDASSPSPPERASTAAEVPRKVTARKETAPGSRVHPSGSTTVTTVPSETTPTTRPHIQLPSIGAATVDPLAATPRSPRKPLAPQSPNLADTPRSPHAAHHPHAPYLPYTPHAPVPPRDSQSPQPPEPPPATPHVDPDRPKNEDATECHPHADGDRDLRKLGGAFERDDGDDGGVKHPRA